MNKQRIIEFGGERLKYYSPYRFLKSVSDQALVEGTFLDPLLGPFSDDSLRMANLSIKGFEYLIVIRKLMWDTKHFNRNVYRIELVIFHPGGEKYLKDAIKSLVEDWFKTGDYIFTQVPTEDLQIINSLTYNGFLMVETRLHYYLADISRISLPKRSVRKAGPADIEPLRKVAEKQRNRFDRVHADPSFTDNEADHYLGVFIENAINGFADIVLVPDIKGEMPFGFLAANNPTQILDYKISKLVLAAIDNTKHRGWLLFLLAGIIEELKNSNTDYLTTITQSSNIPAFKTWEKAGFKLGYLTHILSFSKP